MSWIGRRYDASAARGMVEKARERAVRYVLFTAGSAGEHEQPCDTWRDSRERDC